MVPQSRAWNEQLVRALFDKEVATSVLGVPIIASVKDDKLIWALSNSGELTVRSAYQLCRQVFTPLSDFTVSGNWNLIWNLEVLPKVKHFLWRVCRNMLPVRGRLSDKGVMCSSLCPLCSQNVETSFHLLFSCKRSMDIWLLETLWPNIEVALDQGNDFLDIFLGSVVLYQNRK